MQLSDLPNELLLHIFQSCSSIPDVLNLAATCHHFRSILTPSQRLPVLFQVAEAQFGPLADAISLVTHNTSQPAHIPRVSPPLSFALLTRLLEVGRVANQWTAIYPMRRWRGPDSASRRLLSSRECYRVRRAVYRLWLYTAAFHTVHHPRTTRLSLPIIGIRAALLRPWSTTQLAEILDLHYIFRGVLESFICPSNSQVLRRHRARYLNNSSAPALRFVQSGFSTVQMARAKQVLAQDIFQRPVHVMSIYDYPADVRLGWGDEISNYYVVEDMLKLDPGQLLYLYECVTGSSPTASSGVWYLNHDYHSGGGMTEQCGVVEAFVGGLGEWFENNGSTLAQTAEWVLENRGEDFKELKQEVEDGGGVIGGEDEIEQCVMLC